MIFESPSWVVSSLIVVIPSILASFAVLWLIRKWIPTKVLKENHDVAGFTLGIVGVLYSVILGFTVVNVQNRYNEVLQTIHTEAVSIADLYREAAFFSPSGRDAIRTSLRNYVDYVVKKEWSTPSKKKIPLETQEVINQVWNSYYKIDLEGEKTTIWYTDSISKLNAFMNARLAREFSSWEHLGGMMWSILIIGAIITTCFMFFFGLESFRSQLIMIAFLSGYISFMLYLVYSLDNVFKGPEGLKPIALEQVVNLFDHWDKSQ